MVAKCTCEAARREARAKAFREVLEIPRIGMGSSEYISVLAVRRLANAPQRHSPEATGPISLSGYPDVAEMNEGQNQTFSANIVDCTEDDGFVTVHATDAEALEEFRRVTPFRPAPEIIESDGGLDG